MRRPLLVLVVSLGLWAPAGRTTGAAPPASAATQPRLSPQQWPQVIDRLGEDNDVIVFTRVPGVRWEFDDREVTIPAGQDTVTFPIPSSPASDDPTRVALNGGRVLARGEGETRVLAPGALTTIDPDPEWHVRTLRGTRSTTAVPRLTFAAYPGTLPPTGATQVSFTGFAGATGRLWGDLQWRPVTADQHGRRTGPWLSMPTYPGVDVGDTVDFSGSRGRTYEFRARATDLGNTTESVVTGWSAPRPFAVAQDAATVTGRVSGDMAQVRLRAPSVALNCAAHARAAPGPASRGTATKWP